MTEGLVVLAVDDERPALADLARLLRATDGVARVDTATSGPEALSKIAQRSYDALFLDVRMPQLDGRELARVLQRFSRPPAVVFVTAYEDAAVDAFSLRAVDYLMKPVGRRRLGEAVARIAGAARTQAPAPGLAPTQPDETDVVPAENLRGGTTRLVSRSSVLYLEASGDYVRLVCEDGRYLLRERIGELELRWQPHGFVRVHRRFLANIRRAVELCPNLNGTAELRFGDGSTVPVSRRQVGDLMRRLRA
jgi:DNA-binding LytR/AlgR family response regulator